MNTPINPLPSEEQNGPSCLYKIGYFLIAAAIIGGLLSTTIAAMIWVYQEYMATDDILDGPLAAIVEQTAIAPVNAEAGLGRIAFINADWQVETVDRAGENGRLLTNDNRQYLSPTWSPNGRFIATLNEDGVYKLQDEVDSDVLTLYEDKNDAPVYLYWSPDSSQLGFLAQQNGNALGLFIAPTTGDEVVLQTVASPLYWDWSPTEEQILLHGNGSGRQAELLLMETGIAVEGIPIAQPGAFQAPAFSENGRFYAYAEEQSGGLSWLVITDTAPPTLTPRDIEERHAGMVAMGWSPVADELAYISGEHQGDGFHGALRLLDAESGESRLLSSRQVAAFFWSPNGRFIATLTATAFDDGIYAAIYANSSRVGLMQTHKPITLELAIIEVESGERTKLTTFQPTSHFILQFMPYFDQYARSHRLWSPDSEALVLPMVIEDEAKVVVVGINGRWQEIADGTMPFWSWQ